MYQEKFKEGFNLDFARFTLMYRIYQVGQQNIYL